MNYCHILYNKSGNATTHKLNKKANRFGNKKVLIGDVIIQSEPNPNPQKLRAELGMQKVCLFNPNFLLHKSTIINAPYFCTPST